MSGSGNVRFKFKLKRKQKQKFRRKGWSNWEDYFLASKIETPQQGQHHYLSNVYVLLPFSLMRPSSSVVYSYTENLGREALHEEVVELEEISQNDRIHAD